MAATNQERRKKRLKSEVQNMSLFVKGYKCSNCKQVFDTLSDHQTHDCEEEK